MANMTQPEMPERASVPDSESQTSENVAEPTHIGVARHREAREGFMPPPLQTPDTGLGAPTGPADRSAVDSLRREAERIAVGLTSSPQAEKASSIPLGEPAMPEQRGRGFPLGKTIAGGLGALAVTAAGFLGFNKIHSGDDGSERPGVIITDPTLEPTTHPPTFTPEVTQEPEIIPTPEIKSTPYNFINPKEYLDGKLTLEAEENLPTMTEGPDTFYPGVTSKKTVPYTSSKGLQVNPEYSEAAENVIQGIEIGLLVAWSSQKNIPELQRDIITTDSESKEEQLRKLNLMKERSAKGENFTVTLKSFINDSFVEEDITIDLGNNWKYRINMLSKPPVQVYWQSNSGAGLRISPENNEIRFELLDQFRGGESLDEGILKMRFLSNQISSLISYLPDLVVEDGKVKNEQYKKPGLDYAGTEIKRRNIEFRNKYFLIGEAGNGTLVPIK